MNGRYFRVELKNVPDEILLRDENVFFHGTNKSGSGAISNVIHDAFAHAKKSDLIFSRYHRRPPKSSQLLDIIASAPPARRLLFIDHYLYGSDATRNAPGTFIATFRHPLPRVASCYNWHRRKHESYPTLEEYVERGQGKRDAQITQFGIGFGPERQGLMKQLTLEDIFERAIRNVERDVRWFAIAERFEESIYMFAYLFGLPAVSAWKRDERNQGRPLVGDLPDATCKLIEDVYRYDFAFYAHVLKKFKGWASQIDFGASFPEYQRACESQYKDRILL
jgi:hypothetical protein